MRFTVKERILLHLLESAQSADDPEDSPVLAQEEVVGNQARLRLHTSGEGADWAVLPQ